jgi:hypothetical protein
MKTIKKIKTTKKGFLLLITVIFYCLCLCSCSVRAATVNANHNMYIELYNFLVSRKDIYRGADRNNNIEDLVDVDPITLNEIDFSKEFAVYRFKSRTSSDTYIYALIKYKTNYWIYNTWNVAGIFEELVNIKSNYGQLNDQQIVEIIQKVKYPIKRLFERFGKLKFVSDM